MFSQQIFIKPKHRTILSTGTPLYVPLICIYIQYKYEIHSAVDAHVLISLLLLVSLSNQLKLNDNKCVWAEPVARPALIGCFQESATLSRVINSLGHVHTAEWFRFTVTVKSTNHIITSDVHVSLYTQWSIALQYRCWNIQMRRRGYEYSLCGD